MKKKALIFAAVGVPLIVAIVLVVALVVVPYFTNKFRINVVDDIALGASKKEVRTKLGDPYLEEKTRWGYGDKKLCSYLEDAQDISAAMEEALLQGDLERVERLSRQYENLMDEVASKKFSYIEVNFEDDAVVSVLLDKAYALEPGYKKVKEDKLTYTENGSRFYIPYYEDHTQGKSVMRPLECVVDEELTYYNGKDFSCSTTFTDGSYYQAYVKSFSVEDRYIVWTDEYSNHKAYKPNNLKASVTAFGTISEDGVWHSNVRFKSITIPANVTSIGDYAFANCSGLTSITIPDSVTSIGEDAFHGCSGLETVIWNAENCPVARKIYASNGWIHYSSIFSDCTNLNTVTFGENVKRIPAYAFAYCSGLESVTIGSGVTSIGYQAFAYCSGLEHITVGKGNTAYRSETDCLIEISTKTLITGCKNSLIPNGITSIGDDAFSGCSELTSIIIPDSVTSIGDEAFRWCTGLTNITIPDSVTSIGGSAFEGCSGLTSIEIPDSVTSIGYAAFSDCYRLTKVYYKGTSEEWGNISIDNKYSYNSNLLNTTRYYFTEDKPTAEEWAEWDYWWHYDETGAVAEWVKP